LIDCRLNASNVAVTEAAALKVTLQAPVPEQAPPHPLNLDPVPGVAVNCTTVPFAKLAAQVGPQLMPEGELVTVPVPVPVKVTVSGTLEFAILNVAVTELAEFKVTEHAAVPEHAPDQPAKTEPAAGAAVNCTTLPAVKLALHAFPQLIPEGVLVTLPDPLPARETASENVCGERLKVAETESLFVAPIVTEHDPVPEQAPPHPAKTDPAPGVAVNFTEVPAGKSELQAWPQLIPDGVLVTVPDPDPEIVTTRGRF